MAKAKKSHASEEDVRAFVEAVYGAEQVDLILSFFSERDCLQEATKRLKRLESENTQMRAWLEECANGVMEGECYYDHHGRCQQHLWWDDDTNECIVKRIREFLKPEEPQS